MRRWRLRASSLGGSGASRRPFKSGFATSPDVARVPAMCWVRKRGPSSTKRPSERGTGKIGGRPKSPAVEEHRRCKHVLTPRSRRHRCSSNSEPRETGDRSELWATTRLRLALPPNLSDPPRVDPRPTSPQTHPNHVMGGGGVEEERDGSVHLPNSGAANKDCDDRIVFLLWRARQLSVRLLREPGFGPTSCRCGPNFGRSRPNLATLWHNSINMCRC